MIKDPSFDNRNARKHQDMNGFLDAQAPRLVHKLLTENNDLQNTIIKNVASDNRHLLNEVFQKMDSDYYRFVSASIAHYEFLEQHAAKSQHEKEATRYRLLKELFQLIHNNHWTDRGNSVNDN
jgi:hypothetical protein